jgi:hypothetical protein
VNTSEGSEIQQEAGKIIFIKGASIHYRAIEFALLSVTPASLRIIVSGHLTILGLAQFGKQ